MSQEFDPFVTFVTTRSEPYSVKEIEAPLLVQQVLLEKHNAASVDSPMAATATARLSASDQNTNALAPQVYSAARRSGNGRGFHGGYGRGGRFSGRGGVFCQLCHKQGHTSFNCFHHFDMNFQPQPEPFP